MIKARQIIKLMIFILKTNKLCGTARFTPESDIDLAYQAKLALSPDEELQLLWDFIFLYHRDRIDLVDLNKASPLLMFEVASNGKVLYEENDSFLRFKLKASARYADTQHLRRMRQEYLNQELNNINKILHQGNTY